MGRALWDSGIAQWIEHWACGNIGLNRGDLSLKRNQVSLEGIETDSLVVNNAKP